MKHGCTYAIGHKDHNGRYALIHSTFNVQDCLDFYVSGSTHRWFIYILQHGEQPIPYYRWHAKRRKWIKLHEAPKAINPDEAHIWAYACDADGSIRVIPRKDLDPRYEIELGPCIQGTLLELARLIAEANKYRLVDCKSLDYYPDDIPF